MENTELNITLGEYAKLLDEINGKLNTLTSSTNLQLKAQEAANVKFLATSAALNAMGKVVPGLSTALQTYTAVTKIWGDTTKKSAEKGSDAMNKFNKALGVISIVITVCTALFEKIKERIDSSAEATAKFREVTAKLEPIMKILNSALEVTVDWCIKIIDVVADAANGIAEFGATVKGFFGGGIEGAKEARAEFLKTSEEAEKMAKKENELHQEELKLIEARGKSEAKQGELRDKIANAEGAEKKKLLEQLKKEILAIYDKEIRYQKLKNSVLEYKASLGPTSEAEAKALAEGRAALDKLQGQRDRELARLDKQMSSHSSTVRQTNKEYLDLSEAVKKAYTEMSNFVNDMTEKANQLFTVDRAKLKRDFTLGLIDEDEYNKGLHAIRDAEINNYDERIGDWEAFLKTQEVKLGDSQKVIEEKLKLSQEILNTIRKLGQLRDLAIYDKDVEDFKEAEEKKIKQAEEFQKNLEASATEFLGFLDKSASNWADTMRAKFKTSFKVLTNEEITLSAEEILTAIDGIIESFDKLSKPQQALFDIFGNTTELISNQINLFRDLKKEKGDDLKATEKASAGMKMAAAATKAATNIVNQYMAAKQALIKQDLESGKISEEEAKKQFNKTKKVEIAMATITMMAGIAESIATAMELGFPMGPIVGPLQAAAVAAAGAMLIKNIKATTLEGGGSSSSTSGMSSTFYAGAAANPLLNEDLISQLPVVQGDSAIQDQRVYIVESDIQESNRRVEIRENNTTF